MKHSKRFVILVVLFLAATVFAGGIVANANAGAVPPPDTSPIINNPTNFIPGTAQPADVTQYQQCNNQVGQKCSICTDDTADYPAFKPDNLGNKMITQIFDIANTMLTTLTQTFYNGIVGSTWFTGIVNMVVLFYVLIWGLMILLNLASFRSGEVMSRLIKLAIVWALTANAAQGWTLFSTTIQNPVLNEINYIITAIADTGAAQGDCITAGTIEADGVLTVTPGGGPTTQNIQLQQAPMQMLYGPMSCVFSAKFMAAIEALLKTGSWGFILAIIILWGLIKFVLMLVGAMITYIRSIVGLAFMFGIAPLFFIFYLFEKTRSLTEGWFSMVFGFALQPVMLFTFLAFYMNIVGTSLNNLFLNPAGKPVDICYVPWYNLPGMMTTYWWGFANDQSAGGALTTPKAGGGMNFGDPGLPPIQIINVLYFLVISSLGQSFSEMISTLSQQISGGRGGGVTTGNAVGSWFQNSMSSLTGSRGPLSLGLAKSAASNTMKAVGKLRT